MSPIECAILEPLPEPFEECPKCHIRPFRSFIRGQVQRLPWSWRTLWLPIGEPRPYCAIICYGCKRIVGYE